MRRLSYLATIAIAALLLVVLGPAAGAQTEGQGVVVVPTTEISAIDILLIEDNYFEPTDALVEPGTTLMWVNHGQEQHTVTADDGQFDSGVLNPGDSFLTTVEGSGTLTYHCTLHPEMTGSITVGSPAAGDATGDATGDAGTEEAPAA
jgi:plastocyanin